ASRQEDTREERHAPGDPHSRGARQPSGTWRNTATGPSHHPSAPSGQQHWASEHQPYILLLLRNQCGPRDRTNQTISNKTVLLLEINHSRPGLRPINPINSQLVPVLVEKFLNPLNLRPILRPRPRMILRIRGLNTKPMPLRQGKLGVRRRSVLNRLQISVRLIQPERITIPVNVAGMAVPLQESIRRVALVRDNAPVTGLTDNHAHVVNPTNDSRTLPVEERERANPGRVAEAPLLSKPL